MLQIITRLKNMLIVIIEVKEYVTNNYKIKKKYVDSNYRSERICYK